jgi:hypothetical protein
MVDERVEGRVEGRNEEDQEMFEFPILKIGEQVRMKNINPTTLPHFHGMITKDPSTFLFEFEVLYRTYDYKNDAQKMILFPSTLKEETLRWFMGLDGHSIQTWETMKNIFIEKYKEYCKYRDSRDEIF